MKFQRKILYILSSVFALVLFLGNLPSFAAYEAHVINVTATIKAPVLKILVTKVYYDVDEENKGNEANNEWIEIYNPNQQEVNLKGWQVCDNQVCVSLSSDDLYLPAGGFAVVSRSQSTWQYWNIPGDVLKIVLQNPGNFYLANNGDRVVLKNNSGAEIDAMSYGTDTYAFNPSCPDVPEGHMLGRIPLGLGYQDTDTAADWEDYGLPEVGDIEIYQYGHLVLPDGPLYGNRPATIKWTATNQNGPDSELSIDLLYIMDTNRNGTLDSSDEIYVIAQGIGNTGTYDWTVYPYYGYVWFKVIAQGPENFMISEGVVGYRVYEPPAEDGDEPSAEEETVSSEEENLEDEIIEEETDVTETQEENPGTEIQPEAPLDNEETENNPDETGDTSNEETGNETENTNSETGDENEGEDENGDGSESENGNDNGDEGEGGGENEDDNEDDNEDNNEGDNPDEGENLTEDTTE